MTSSTKNISNKVQNIINKICKFYANRLSPIWEIACTKLVRKKKKNKKNKNSKNNNNVFRWKRNTLNINKGIFFHVISMCSRFATICTETISKCWVLNSKYSLHCTWNVPVFFNAFYKSRILKYMKIMATLVIIC